MFLRHLLRQISYPLTAYIRPKEAVFQRLPWLLITLSAGTISGIIISHFQGTIERKVALTVFMPILIGLGGNAGTQTLSLVVRGLALDELRTRQILRIIIYELRTGILLGGILGTTVGLIAYLWKQDLVLGWIVGLSLICTMSISTVAGASIPLCLKTLRIDPALASGPFITTIVDAIGVLIYLYIATMFIGLNP